MINIKNLDPNKIKIIKKLYKNTLISTSDMWSWKTFAIQKLIMWILYTLLLIKYMDRLEKAMVINIWCYFLMMKVKER